MAGSLEPYRYSKRGQVYLIVKIILVYIDGRPSWTTIVLYSRAVPKSHYVRTISGNITLAACYSGERISAESVSGSGGSLSL